MTPRRVVEKCLMFKEELRITKQRVAPRDLQFVILRTEDDDRARRKPGSRKDWLRVGDRYGQPGRVGWTQPRICMNHGPPTPNDRLRESRIQCGVHRSSTMSHKGLPRQRSLPLIDIRSKLASGGIMADPRSHAPRQPEPAEQSSSLAPRPGHQCAGYPDAQRDGDEPRHDAPQHVGQREAHLPTLPEGQRIEREGREGRVAPRNPTTTSSRTCGWGSHRARAIVSKPMGFRSGSWWPASRVPTAWGGLFRVGPTEVGPNHNRRLHLVIAWVPPDRESRCDHQIPNRSQNNFTAEDDAEVEERRPREDQRSQMG
jgi:hypothetical protein